MIQKVPRSAITASGEELSALRLDVLQTPLRGPDGAPQISGGVPRDLAGHVFIVGPIGSVESGGLPNPSGAPIFNGNGMIYRIDLAAEGGPTVSSKIASTPCYHADAASVDGAHEALRFHDFGLLRFSPLLGLRNELNTALLPMVTAGRAPRLLVTYDAGRPYEIDTASLELATPVGWNHEWAPALPFPFPFPIVLTTAHPGFDARTGELLTVNFGRSVLNLLTGPLPAARAPVALPPALDRAAHAGASMLEKSRVLAPLGALIRGAGRARRALRELFAHPPGPLAGLGKRLDTERVKLLEQGSDFVHLLRWDGSGRLERFHVVDEEGAPLRIEQSMHQIAITERYVVLLDSAFKIGVESIVNPIPASPGLQRLLRAALTRPQSPSTVLYLVPRRELRAGAEVVRARRVVIPLETVHFLADHDDEGDRITLLCAHNTGADVSEWIRPYDVDPVTGEPVPAHLFGQLTIGQADASRLGRYVIEGSTGRILEQQVFADPELASGIGLYAFRDLLPSGELPRRHENVYWQGWGMWSELSTAFLDNLYARHPHRLVPLDQIRRMRAEGRPASLFRLDLATMTIADRYEAPLREQGYWIGTPQFVPKQGGPGGDTDGYIVTTVNTVDGGEIWIFDAADLARGPLCRLGHPSLSFGFTIHAAWLPSVGPRTEAYAVPARQDYGPSLDLALPAVRSLFERAVYPNVR